MFNIFKKRKSKFNKYWEPNILSQDILAKGIWYYDEIIPYEIILIRIKYDYTSLDLSEIEKNASEITISDYIDYNINENGYLFFWQIRTGPNNITTSSTFSSYEKAKEHVKKYGKSTITWLVE